MNTDAKPPVCAHAKTTPAVQSMPQTRSASMKNRMMIRPGLGVAGMVAVFLSAVLLPTLWQPGSAQAQAEAAIPTAEEADTERTEKPAAGAKTAVPAEASTDAIAGAPAVLTTKPDAQMQAVLNELAALGGKPIETLTAEEARNQPTPTDAVLELMKKQGKKGPEEVGAVDDIKIKLESGSVKARVYSPEGKGPFPVILYIHGGGWVLADLDVYDATPRALCNAAQAVVISTDYRLAPEHKFPAAHEDVYGVYQWALANAEKYQGVAGKIAVVGESAGGNMALSVCEMAKSAGIKQPIHQVLIYPVANYAFDTPSYHEHARAKPLNAAMMHWFFEKTLSSAADGRDPKISPLRSEKLAGLPPATVITAEIDPLRSEGEALAEKLKQAGVPVNYRNYEGVTHEFFGMGAVVDTAQKAVQMVAEDLKKAFKSSDVNAHHAQAGEIN